jgi:phosphoserine phosphatase
VSNSAKKIALQRISSSNLSDVILLNQPSASFPFSFHLSAKDLIIDSQCSCADNFESSDTDLVTVEPSHNVELVVFSDISFNLLQQLINTCDVTLVALNAINTRNNLTSYRFDIVVNDLVQARQHLISFTETHAFEAAIVQNAPKFNVPGLLVMDMDSTTIEIECIDEIAVLAGVGEEVSAVTELAMQGKLDFTQSLYQRVATLKDSPEQILADVAKDIPLMNGLEVLIKELKQYQWRVAIASGGFTYFADYLKELLGLDAAYANTLEIVDGKLTGKVLGKVVDANVKAECLNALSQEYSISHQQTVAMGDGANDLVMMEAANLGVAFHAKSIVKAKADTAISHTGLDCMIHWLA